ncbi:MAG: SDR family NAD(P)-dependent oxidoreductase, partial [Thermomicrobiales bacterium]|nr:SDR family NAD(P)-dependent oxidoreductase [Thermomicrobiales bacterium]
MTKTPGGASPWPGRWAGEAFAYLTTTGRQTGQPHRIEIWFAAEGGRLYLLAGGRERADWVRNLRANPHITVELGGETRPGLARVLQAGEAGDQRARELLVEKYREGDNLDAWGRDSLAVTVEFAANDIQAAPAGSPAGGGLDTEEHKVTMSGGRFAGRVAFITGGSSGIGRATAIAFAREGARVAVMSLSEEGNQETVRLVETDGGGALAITGDVSQSADLERALRATIEAFGRLDYAFNNAGIEQPVAALADISEAEWARLIAVDLTGVFLGMKHQIPLLQRQGGGA